MVVPVVSGRLIIATVSTVPQSIASRAPLGSTTTADGKPTETATPPPCGTCSTDSSAAFTSS
jgi:hypothetical protein